MGSAKYRVAIIGAGRMGGLLEDEAPPNRYRKPHGHFAAYNYVEETEVVAVAGHSEGRLKMFTERFGIANTYLDYREMIEKEKPDIVSVTTQAWKRAEPLVFAAEHGVKGIFAEKALCASLEEADRIARAVKANDVAFNYGAERRHHDGYIALRQAVERGDIGEPEFAFCFWRTDLMKHHSHSFDTVSMLLGDPKPTCTRDRFRYRRTTRRETSSSRRTVSITPSRFWDSRGSATRMVPKGSSCRGRAARSSRCTAVKGGRSPGTTATTFSSGDAVPRSRRHASGRPARARRS